MREDLLSLVAARTGHFRLESGHHTNRWLDLEGLFVQPARIRPFLDRLAQLLGRYKVDAVCGPQVGGAFLAQALASTLGLECFFTERLVPPSPSGLFKVRYQLPESLRPHVAGKRFAIVDDAISAGSAAKGTYNDLRSHAAETVVIGALLTLGAEGVGFFRQEGVPIESVMQFSFDLWLPQQCPLCASGAPLEDPSPPLQ